MEHPSIDCCPSCGNKCATKTLSLRDWFLSQENFSLLKCDKCSLVYTSTLPQNIGEYYKSDEYISHSEKKTLLSSIYGLVQRTTLKTKKRIVLSNSPGKRLLDYGAGKGDFSGFMASSGFNVTGYEPDSEARNLAKEKNGIHLFDNIDSISSSSIDAITMWHVLEHIPNPNQILQSLTQKLVSNGTLIIAVPNHKSYDAEYYGKFWAAYDVPRHITHYDLNSMDILLKRNSLKIIETKRMWFDSTYVSLLSEKYKARQSESEPSLFNQIRALAIGLLSNISSLSNISRCSSIVYIIKPIT